MRAGGIPGRENKVEEGESQQNHALQELGIGNLAGLTACEGLSPLTDAEFRLGALKARCSAAVTDKGNSEFPGPKELSPT